MVRPLAPRRARIRTLALTGLGALVAGVLTAPVATTPAHADDARTLTVIGPTAFADSQLWAEVLKPSIAQAVEADGSGPVSMTYVALDGAAAVDRARTEPGSVLLVDSPDEEVGLVADGVSGVVGRSLLWSDLVLIGARADPAEVRATAPQDLVAAFERVAAVGPGGDADFVSRTGTSEATVAEHALWALTDGVRTCTVSEADGGGAMPSTVTGPCPETVPTPSWYRRVDADQPYAVGEALSCDGRCYVLSDRGTGAYLGSVGELGDLRVVGKGGVADQLDVTVSSYRAYAIRPAAGTTSLAGTAIRALTDDGRRAGAPQRIDRHLGADGRGPYRSSSLLAFTTTPSPAEIDLGESVTLQGRLATPVPGAVQPVGGAGVEFGYVTDPTASDGSYAIEIETVTTDSDGRFTLATQTPDKSQGYYLTTDAITVNDPDVPDLRYSFVGRDFDRETDVRTSIGVHARLDGTRVVRGTGGRFRIRTTLAPQAFHRSRVYLYAGRPGRPRVQRAQVTLRSGTTAFDRAFRLAPGRWNLLVRFDPGAGHLLDAEQAQTVVLR